MGSESFVRLDREAESEAIARRDLDAVLNHDLGANACAAGRGGLHYSSAGGSDDKGPFTVRFGLRGMGVTRAGDTTAHVGHHHLLVDAEGELSRTNPIPTDRRHLHFGGGQTETQLDLPPGKHSLQLVLGDAEHKLFNPPVISKKITVTVLDPNAPVVKQNVVRKRTVRTKATQRRTTARSNSR